MVINPRLLSDRYQSVRVSFQQNFSACYTFLMCHKNGETAFNGYNPALFMLPLSVSGLCLAKVIFAKYDQSFRVIWLEFHDVKEYNGHFLDFKDGRDFSRPVNGCLLQYFCGNVRELQQNRYVQRPLGGTEWDTADNECEHGVEDHDYNG